MKIFKKTLASFMAMTTVFSAVSFNTFADETGGFTMKEIENSPIKPVLSISSECISLDEAKANPTRKISLSVSGANKKYVSTGIHIFYDKRLKVQENVFGYPDLDTGNAIKYLQTDSIKDLTNPDMDGIFVTTAESGDYGLDGVMWEIPFILPDDVQEGDVFPIDIRYKENENAKDLFTSIKNNETSRLMQAYTFTKGIYNPTANYNFCASAEDIAKNSALADIDKSFDGYIAIEDKTTTTTKAATTTTTRTTATSKDSHKTSATNFLPEASGFSMAEIENSPIKPVLSISSECIPLDEAKANPKRKVTLSVNGADKKYESTGIHVFYDKRLKVQENAQGNPDVKRGEAAMLLAYEPPMYVKYESDMDGFFVATAAAENLGFDGVMWEIPFILPDDVKEGDVFPIDIRYASNERAEDLFTNTDEDELMQAYTFTKGIYNSITNYNFAASAGDIAKNSALADIDKSFDGYIAIEDKEVTTTTTTTTKLTTTTTSITTTKTSTTTTSAATSLPELFGFSVEEVENSPVKPVLSLSNECISLEEAKANPTRKISLSVSGADKKYSSTGILIYYDKRLKIEENMFGYPEVESGKAIKYLSADTPNFVETNPFMDGIFLCTAAMNDFGLDGVMWEFNFILPDDVQEGDVFPIDIKYESNPNMLSLFTNCAWDETGTLMQAYAFTKGIYNSTTNYNFAASAKDIKKNSNLLYIDKSFDGYIAVERSGKAESAVIGDANGDETMNIADATLIVQHVGNKDKYKLSEQAEINCDVDGTPGITGTDALIIQMAVAGIIEKTKLPL